MNLHPRALEGFASNERHTITVKDVYTGRKYSAVLARETKCYYVVWVKGLVNNTYSDLNLTLEGVTESVVERRFHKATMTNIDLNLYIEDKADDSAAAPSDTQAAKDCPVVASEVSEGADYIPATDAEESTASQPVNPVYKEVRQRNQAAADLHDAPAFCTNCETYVKHDELIFNEPSASIVCIDCDDELDTNHRTVIATIKNVALLNYMGGHLGFNFTPTLKELPSMLTAFRPNTGNVGSPNEMLARIGGFMVMAARNSDTRVIYNACGEYIAHGNYDEINNALLAIIDAE